MEPTSLVMLVSFGKIPIYIGAALELLVQALDRAGRVQLRPMRGGEGLVSVSV
jgi:hypothetical protein